MATGKRERNEVVERELEQALRTMHDAHRRNDLAYLDEAMADDFTIIHANGDLLTKEEWFADLRSGATSWERLDVPKATWGLGRRKNPARDDDRNA